MIRITIEKCTIAAFIVGYILGLAKRVDIECTKNKKTENDKKGEF